MIDVAEFGHLWQYVQEWKGCFDRSVLLLVMLSEKAVFATNRFDTDRSGNISPDELNQALSSFGYRL